MTKDNNVNSQSSRSHLIIKFLINSLTTPDQIGTLNLVDLAGSERLSTKDKNVDEDETTFINLSLMSLKNVIRGQFKKDY